MAESEKQIQNGSVVAVDATAKTLQVKGDSSDVALGLDDATTITVNGRYRVIADLAAGQQVKKIYYIDKGGKKTATVVHVVDEKLLKAQQEKKGPAGKEERKPAI